MLLIERKKVKQMESNDFCDLLLMLLDDDLFWVDGDEKCTDSSSRIPQERALETAQ
jgi:hypothetical protein